EFLLFHLLSTVYRQLILSQHPSHRINKVIKVEVKVSRCHGSSVPNFPRNHRCIPPPGPQSRSTSRSSLHSPLSDLASSIASLRPLLIIIRVTYSLPLKPAAASTLIISYLPPNKSYCQRQHHLIFSTS